MRLLKRLPARDESERALNRSRCLGQGGATLIDKFFPIRLQERILQNKKQKIDVNWCISTIAK